MAMSCRHTQREMGPQAAKLHTGGGEGSGWGFGFRGWGGGGVGVWVGGGGGGVMGKWEEGSQKALEGSEGDVRHLRPMKGRTAEESLAIL